MNTKDYGFSWHSRMTSSQSEKAKILQDKGWKILCINSHKEVVMYHHDTTNRHCLPR